MQHASVIARLCLLSMGRVIGGDGRCGGCALIAMSCLEAPLLCATS